MAAKARFRLPPTSAARARPRSGRSPTAWWSPPRFRSWTSTGRLAGILYGGNLLNRRHELVDSIKREVFPDETYEGKEIGTVTIFQGDLRIATNVIAEDGSRAVGTRMSEAVYDEVIRRGGTWSKPAFVVNDWYITAYEPIRDPPQRIIGAIYVGLLQAPFAHAQTTVIVRFLAADDRGHGRQSRADLPGDDGGDAAHRANRRHVAEGDRPATFRPGWASARRAKWASCARPSTPWPTPSPNAKSSSNRPSASR